MHFFKAMSSTSAVPQEAQHDVSGSLLLLSSVIVMIIAATTRDDKPAQLAFQAPYNGW